MKRFVYWEPGSCINLALVKFKKREQCKICFDYFLRKEGYLCSKGHFLCWNCYEQNASQASEPGAVGHCIDENGDLLCVECREPMTLFKVAKETVPQKIFDLQERIKSDVKTKKTVEKALKEQEIRLNREFERILAIKDEEERTAERLRLEIIENILTLKCPRCKVAFLDYSGCAALTCSTCQAGFCACCLKDCGNNAHSHVLECSPNGTYFVTNEEFIRIHSQRREKLISEKMKNESEKVKKTIREKMRKDFDDLGIKI